MGVTLRVTLSEEQEIILRNEACRNNDILGFFDLPEKTRKFFVSLRNYENIISDTDRFLSDLAFMREL